MYRLILVNEWTPRGWHSSVTVGRLEADAEAVNLQEDEDEDVIVYVP
jgi:hypothetical protein